MYRLLLFLWVFTTVLLGFTLPSLSRVEAANFTASPLLIDKTVEARDIINETVTLYNTTDRPIRAYATVHEVALGSGSEILEFIPGSMTPDRSTAITSWIEISRARLEIPANGSLDIPLTIRVHPEAPAGSYHALIGFAAGRNRDEIEAQVIAGGGVTSLLKLTIPDTRQTELRLVNFLTDRFVISSEDNNLRFTIENTGDVPLTPTGEVIIYDTSGRELAFVSANSEGHTVAPGERLEIIEELPFTERLGRNKAYLSLEYGDNRASVFDTTFYYSVPWYFVAIFLVILIAIMLLLGFIFRRALTGSSVAADGLYDVPLFYRESHDHPSFEHDLNLKHDDQKS